MPYPWSAGNTLTAVDLNATLAELRVNDGRHVCILSDTAQSYTTVTVQSITFGTETEDTDAFHGPGGANITIPTGLSGMYVMSARVVRASGNWIGTSSYIQITLSTGGQWQFPGTGTDTMCATLVAQLEPTYVVSVQVFNGAATVNADSTFYMARLPYTFY